MFYLLCELVYQTFLLVVGLTNYASGPAAGVLEERFPGPQSWKELHCGLKGSLRW